METTFTKSDERSSKIILAICMLLLLLSLVTVVVLAIILRDELKKNKEMPETPLPNDMCEGNTIDVAIVGAGISGAFSAWHLATNNPHWTINVYDANYRVGGRLLSIKIPGIPNHVAELGDLRMKPSHVKTSRVISQLGLTKDSFFVPNENNTLYFLREKWMNSDDISKGNVPFDMKDYERSISGNSDALMGYWNNMLLDNATMSLNGWEQVCTDGKMAYEKGIYNALHEVGSTEAIKYLAYRSQFVGGYFSNPNYVEYSGILGPGSNTPEPRFAVREGFEELVKKMIEKFQQPNQNRLFLNNKLVSVSHKNHLAQLRFYDSSRYEYVDVCARKVILGLPPDAWKLIQMDRDLTMAMSPLVHSVQGGGSGKIYLAYDHPWWRSVSQGPVFDGLRQNGEDLKFMVTDTPAGTVLDIGQDNVTGKALLLSYYDFWENVLYWQPYQDHGTPHVSSLSPEMPVTVNLVKEIHHHLAEIFNISEGSIPEPYASATQAWYKAPYHVAWYSPNAGYNYPKVQSKIMKPVANKDLFIVGEAFSDSQGWTEGALETAEKVLTKYFGINQF